MHDDIGTCASQRAERSLPNRQRAVVAVGKAKSAGAHERAYGAFTRAFDLPPSVDETSIRAEHRDGVLTLRLPKREAPVGRSFRVEIE